MPLGVTVCAHAAQNWTGVLSRKCSCFAPSVSAALTKCLMKMNEWYVSHFFVTSLSGIFYTDEHLTAACKKAENLVKVTWGKSCYRTQYYICIQILGEVYSNRKYWCTGGSKTCASCTEIDLIFFMILTTLSEPWRKPEIIVQQDFKHSFLIFDALFMHCLCNEFS